MRQRGVGERWKQGQTRESREGGTDRQTDRQREGENRERDKVKGFVPALRELGVPT